MREQIGKVQLNYEFYDGNDSYSDGEIEDYLLELVKSDESIEDILARETQWPVLYYLSSVRENILEWYPFLETGSVLEVGAGCGALTGMLARKTGKVVCVELSKKRSLINANKNKAYDNVEIMVGNFNNMQFEEKFDYITLIGVLEYAAYYTEGSNPFVQFLSNLKQRLKPNGKILIAIENKFGLKYWAGAREDHTGLFFDGLEGYHGTTGKVRTFSKPELSEIIQKAGYTQQRFYYPFPDYKFPTRIFSDEYLPHGEDLICGRTSYDNSRLVLFDETSVYHELVQCGQYEFFANSFLVEIA